MEQVRRRNLSGIYIFEKFEDEDRREPTCFEDCTEETQNKWLDSLAPEALKNLVKVLASTLKTISEQFDIIREEKVPLEEELEELEREL